MPSGSKPSRSSGKVASVAGGAVLPDLREACSEGVNGRLGLVFVIVTDWGDLAGQRMSPGLAVVEAG
jgi:hypothetical protein